MSCSPPAPPSSLGTSGLIPASHPSEPSPLPRPGCPEHPAPKPPRHFAPQKAFQAPFPKVLRRPRAAVPGRWMEPRGAGAPLPHGILAAQGHRQHRGCSFCPSRGAARCGNRTAWAPLPSAKPLPRHNVPLCAAGPLLPPSSPHRFPAAPYSRQCHPLPALLEDRGALVDQALPAALAKGKKGTGPRSERSSRTPRDAGGQRGPRTQRLLSVCAGHLSPECWDGVSTPRCRSSAPPHGSPTAWPGVPGKRHGW